MCVQVSCDLDRIKKAWVSLSKSAEMASASRVSFVRRFCLSAIACRRLWPGGCKMSVHTLPSGWIWPSGWGYLFDCKLPCPILADGPISFETLFNYTDIQAKKTILTLKNIEKKTFALKRFASFFCVHISKKIYENSL